MMTRNRLAHIHRSTVATKRALRYRRGNSCFDFDWSRILVAVVITLGLFSLANQKGKGAMREDNGEHQHIIVPTGETLESAKQRQHLSSPRNGAIGRNDDGMQMAQREGTGRNQQQDGGGWQQKKPTNQDVNSPIDGRTSSIESWRGVRGSDRAQAAEELWREQDEVLAPAAVTRKASGDTATAHISVRSTALLVAIDGDVKGLSSLTMWSDFVLTAQGRTTTALKQGRKQARECDSTSRQTEESMSLGVGRQGQKTTERAGEGSVEQGEEYQVFAQFPAVWIITSDPGIDKTVRECMPHLLPFFVPGFFGGDTGQGPKNSGEVPSWSDLLDRFSSGIPDVDVFGIFGEGTLPTAALLPFSLQSFFAASDAADGRVPSDAAGGNDCRGGCAIESFLWPVLSKSSSPMAVLSRSRGWWAEDSAEGVVDGRGVVGEWMPDKFVAQIWCNRAMLATSRRSATGLGEADSVGSEELSSFLHVIQRLVRRPDEVGAVLIDGTKAAPSRYWYPPAVAVGDGGSSRSGGAAGDVGEERVYLSRLSKNALERADRERQQEKAKQEHQSLRETSPSVSTSPPVAISSQRQPLPEVDFYVGALQLSLGFESHSVLLDAENSAGAAKQVPSGAPPSWAGKFNSGRGKIDDGDGGLRSGNGRISADVGAVVEARWPPEYILESVQQLALKTEGVGSGHVFSPPLLLFPDDVGIRNDNGYRDDTQQQGLVVVSSVNCGYLDMAVNFLHSVRRVRRDVKVLFVAMDEVAFDFLDRFSPGRTVLFHRKDSEREHAGKAGEYGDDIFKRQTLVRPEILLGIMKQGYRALWTDVDIVWLGNALDVLPVPQKKDNSVEVMVPMDGPSVKCTCFIYLNHTPNTIRLLELWKKNIMENDFRHDQDAFRQPLREMERAGLRLKILPDEVMPPGNKIFEEAFLEKNYERYEDKLLIVHNNWVFGHSAKRERFCEAGLWHVDGTSFPTC